MSGPADEVFSVAVVGTAVRLTADIGNDQELEMTMPAATAAWLAVQLLGAFDVIAGAIEEEI